jgi:acyl-CoA thioester hydrolase
VSDGIEVWSGGVNTWECDEMGHLNVRFWVTKAMEGLGAFVAELGLPRALAPEAETTFLVQEHHIRFLKEARAGAALWMSGAVVELGEDWAQLALVIRHPDGTPGATFQTRVLHVATSDLSARPWPQRVRDRSVGMMGSVPPFAAARSVGATGPWSARLCGPGPAGHICRPKTYFPGITLRYTASTSPTTCSHA